jgi:proline racemase
VRIQTTDYHTAGEPFRIVSGGTPLLQGSTVLERRASALRDHDRVRQLLVFEPRGHADMYGCFVVPGNDEGAHLGTVFFHNAGYSTACGHGTIALVTWALESGLIDAPDGRVVLDVPSGRLETVARIEGGRVRSVRFRNVPAYVVARALSVATPRGPVMADVSFGGAFYASVAVDELDLDLSPASLPELIDIGRHIKRELEARQSFHDPVEPRLEGIYGVIFHVDVDADGPALVQQNVAVFADGEVDRSPCGSGTSARLALLHDAGALATGQEFRHLGITGESFSSCVVETTTHGGLAAVITEIEGSAYLTGHHTFILQPDDPLDTGFLLR